MDMLTYAMDNPAPGTIILISSDGDFSYAVSTLRLRRYHVVVVGLPEVHQSLKAQASLFVNWNAEILENSEAHRESPIKQHDLGRRQLQVSSDFLDASPPYHYLSASSRPKSERFRDDSERMGQFRTTKDPTLGVRTVPLHTKTSHAVPERTAVWRPTAPNFPASTTKPHITDFRKSNTGGHFIEPLASTVKPDDVRFNDVGGSFAARQTALFSSSSIPLSGTGPRTSLLRDGAPPVNIKYESRTESLPYPTQSNLSSEFNSLVHDIRGEEKASKSFTSATVPTRISLVENNDPTGLPTLSIRGIGNDHNGSQDHSSVNKSVRHSDTSVSSAASQGGETGPTVSSLGQASSNEHVDARPLSPLLQAREVSSPTVVSTSTLRASSSPVDSHASKSVTEEITSTDAALGAAKNADLYDISHTASGGGAPRFDDAQMGEHLSCEEIESVTGLNAYARPHTSSELRVASPSSSSRSQPAYRYPPTLSASSQNWADTVIPPHFEILVQELRRQLANGISRPSRSEVAIEIKKQDPHVYERAGVTKFKEFSALAVEAKAIVLGGLAGDAWISLPPISTTIVQSGPETLRSGLRNPYQFRYLVEQLQIARQSGATQPLRSVIGQALATRCKSLHQDTGFPTFKEYVTAAEKAGVVRLGGNNGHAWVSLI